MRRSMAPALWAVVLTAFGGAWACSNDDSPSAPGSGGTSSGGAKAHAGSATTQGGAEGGATPSDGGDATNRGGTSAGGADNPVGGAPSIGGAAEATGGSSAGAGAAGGSEGGPDPDLITATGGPWPDSLTGACSNASKSIICPQMGEAFFGQDGSYRLNVPSYTTTTASLKDSVTGLVWQRTPDPTKKTQAAATTYCDDLELGGQTDWRLPTRIEYVSVLDLGMGSGYAMPADILLETTGPQWTASATGSTTGQFFFIDDKNGTWTLGEESTELGARCVRGTAFTGSLQVETDVVTDTMTQLVWQVTGLAPALRTWEQALDDCESSTYANQSDWRLPNIKELATLVDEAATVPPAIRVELGTDAAPHYWSSTPSPGFGGERYAQALETSVGISTSFKMTDSAAAVRCVRSQP